VVDFELDSVDYPVRRPGRVVKEFVQQGRSEYIPGSFIQISGRRGSEASVRAKLSNSAPSDERLRRPTQFPVRIAGPKKSVLPPFSAGRDNGD